MKKTFLVLLLILAVTAVNARDWAVRCGPASTFSDTDGYTCIVDNANAQTFGAGQAADLILINQIEWTDGTNPLDVANLEIRNANAVFGRGAQLSFSSRKFKNVKITGSTFELSSLSVGGSESVVLLNPQLTATDTVNLNAPNIDINGGRVTAPRFRVSTNGVIVVHADGSPLLPGEEFNPDIADKIVDVQPQYLNITNFFSVNPLIRNPGQNNQQVLATDVELTSKGSLKLTGLNWVNPLGNVEITGNNLEVDFRALVSKKLNVQIVQNITGVMPVRAENEINIASGKNITLNVGNDAAGNGLVSSNGFVSVVGNENVDLNGDVTSGGIYGRVNANRLSAADSLLNLVDLEWKNKSGVFIKAGKTLTINGNAINAKEYAKSASRNELERRDTPIDWFERPDGNNVFTINYYQLLPANDADGSLSKIILTLPESTNINYAVNSARGIIGVKSGDLTCEFLIRASQNNQILVAAKVTSGNNILSSQILRNTQVPFTIEMTKYNCKFMAGNAPQFTYNFNAQLNLAQAPLQVGWNRFEEDYFSTSDIKIKYVNSNPAVTLSGEVVNLNSRLVNASGAALVKAIQLNTALRPAGVIPGDSKVVSCNEDHSLMPLFDPVLTSRSGICPERRKFYIYGQLAQGGANITTGSVKVTNIVNLRTGQLVNYTLRGLTQPWNATFNDVFDVNGTFSLTLGAGPDNVNPTLITEGGRHEVFLLIDKQNEQFNCETEQCIVKSVMVNVQ